MSSKVLTNDVDKRKEFKERASQRVSEVLADPVEESVPIIPVDVEVPSNFWELSDVELYGILKYQQLTPEQTTRVVNQLKGYTSGTKEFKIVLQSPVVEEEVFVQADPITQTIQIKLPHDFQAYPDREKFLFLTRERALSAEKANDLIFVLNGDSPINPHIEYDVSFSEKVVEDNSIGEYKTFNTIGITLPHGFKNLKRVYQEETLTKDYGLSILDALDVLATINGNPVANSKIDVEFEEPVLKEEVFVRADPITEIIQIELPHDFQSYLDREKFLFLTRERALSAEKANDLIFVLNGDSPVNQHIEYDVSFSEKAVEDEFGEDKEVLNPIDITLPHGFKNLKRVYQETMLTSEYGLSILEAFDVLSVINGEQPLYRDREIFVAYEEPVVEEKISEVEEYPELTVDLPDRFESMRPQEQYLYLKTELRLTADQANDVISVFRGNSPIYSKVIIN